MHIPSGPFIFWHEIHKSAQIHRSGGRNRGVESEAVMNTAKRTREELIAICYCPNCGRCTRTLHGAGLENWGILHECGKCGTLLLELRHPQETLEWSDFVEVTHHWDEIRDWYEKRREEIEAQKWDLEMQFKAEARQRIATIVCFGRPRKHNQKPVLDENL